MPSVLCLSGLDPTGHAGLSVDIWVLACLGVRCLPVATTLTVQGKDSFSESHPVHERIIEKQLDVIFSTEKPGAVKLGVLGSAPIARLIANYTPLRSLPVVTDPVFLSTSGHIFADDEMVEIYKQSILPLSRLLTPNAHEATILSGLKVEDIEHAKAACKEIFALGPGSVLLKGGHFKHSVGTDVYYDSGGCRLFEGAAHNIKIRGTGCALSSMLAGYLSSEIEVPQAVRMSKDCMNRALSSASSCNVSDDFGRGMDWCTIFGACRGPIEMNHGGIS